MSKFLKIMKGVHRYILTNKQKAAIEDAYITLGRAIESKSRSKNPFYTFEEEELLLALKDLIYSKFERIS